MSVISKMRKQKAMAWVRSSLDAYGNPEFSSPVEVKCRWDDQSEVFVSAESKEEISRAVVYPDRALNEGDYLLKMTEAEFDALGLSSSERLNPQNIEGAFPVRATAANPNFKATEILYTAFL